MSGQAWVDGDLVPRATLAADADGVFETIGAFGGALPLWRAHLHRLQRSAARLGWPCRLAEGVEVAAGELLRAHGHQVLRLALERAGRGTRVVMTTRVRDGEQEPLRVLLAATPRPIAADADLKTCRRTYLQASREQARARGAHDALLWRDGLLLEATAYNVFLVAGGRLRTPPADGAILPGIAREVLLRAGLPVEVGPVALEDAIDSPLLVLTNAVYGPRLAALAGTVAAGSSDAVLARLRAAWQEAVGP